MIDFIQRPNTEKSHIYPITSVSVFLANSCYSDDIIITHTQLGCYTLEMTIILIQNIVNTVLIWENMLIFKKRTAIYRPFTLYQIIVLNVFYLSYLIFTLVFEESTIFHSNFINEEH